MIGFYVCSVPEKFKTAKPLDSTCVIINCSFLYSKYYDQNCLIWYHPVSLAPYQYTLGTRVQSNANNFLIHYFSFYFV